jgi:antirestriction protein ArdC
MDATQTVDARNEKRTQLLAQLAQQVESLKASEGWTAWMETAAKFHRYSLGNQLLILRQRPDASQVAGFQTWKSLGRHVRKGEKGIAIFAPCPVKRVDDETGEEERRLFFRIVHVFDMAQTDGADLPTMSWPLLADGPAGLFDELRAVAERLSLRVTITDASPSGARGWYEPGARSITIVNAFPAASMARTMLHELGHALDIDAASRAERELVAESVAYIVGKRIGLHTDDCSTFYTASWGAEPKKLEALAERVLDIARRLEDAIQSESGEEVAA